MVATCCLEECSIRICCAETTTGPVGMAPPRAKVLVFTDVNGTALLLEGTFLRG
jgi:hypothetical protein